MTKFIKALIIINGVIIPLLVLFLVYKLISDSFNRYGDYEPNGVIVGESLNQAKKDSLAIQGISYESPISVYNSTNFYLPVSVINYKEAKSLKKEEYSSFGIGGASRAYLRNGDNSNYFNIIFLDKEYQVIRELVTRKASITDIFMHQKSYSNMEEPVDELAKNIAYQIAFDDTNKDGKLDGLDFHDLFISDLEGSHLVQVTSGKDIIDLEFINSNSELFIRFKDRNEQVKDEYKRIKFGRYVIATGEFKELKGIEEKLSEIESKLVQ